LSSASLHWELAFTLADLLRPIGMPLLENVNFEFAMFLNF